ncbi:D-2-hydroxyacid dehydrogenase [Gaetbulibacter saemankumensis]|uniref:D-2-hydroxyacid dehydrogenase n=1 Tax=Gaetbulibacter saemankumensis TaxID=311208 RepID=UPI000419A50F|nr:D-2-hydroxyacid dehydrogenase [Gaetbulibacter saemankumensis]
MKIVVLDGYALNPGDLSWKGIEEFGDITVYDRTKFETQEILSRIQNAEVVFTNKTPLSTEVLEQCEALKYIGVLATGYNVVDVDTAKKQGIIVANVPAYSTHAVAQFTMALLLEMCHQVGDHNQSVHEGHWAKSLDFSYWNSPLIELQGKTFGVIGFGRIGQAVAKLVQAFGLHILVYSRTRKPEIESETCEFVELNTLLECSDFISLHCPLFESTIGIINKSNISKMKTGVKIINTSRGGLIVETDLAEALNSGKVSAAAVDVVSEEPIKPNNPLLQAKNCIITPHIAWAPIEARARLMDITVKNLEAFFKGHPVNVVNS